MDIEFKKLYIHQMQPELLKDGEKQIRESLKKWYDYALPNDFDWTPVLPAGRVTRRVSKAAHDEGKFNLPQPIINEYGKIHEKFWSDGEKFYFDFTNEFDWKAGDFGDEFSCFFSYNKHERDWIADNGGYAVRFYSDETQKKGVARAWMFPIPEGVVIFNGKGSLNQDKICTILSLWSGEYAHMDVNFSYETNRRFYLDHGHGELISTLEKIDRPLKVKLPPLKG